MATNYNKLFGSLLSILKAAPGDKLADLKDAIDHDGVQDIDDMWDGKNGEHEAPSRAQIVTGPSESASGAGAGKMVREYSDFARQDGLTGLYDRINGWVEDFRKGMSRQQRQIGALAGVVSDMSKSHAAMLKALEDAQTAGTAGSDLEGAGTLVFTTKAVEKIAKARKAFIKAESDEDEDEREERKSKLQEVADLLKSAKQKLIKAEDEDEDEDKVEKALEDYKKLNARVTKALAAIKAEEDKEKEEAEKAKATAKAEHEDEEEKGEEKKSSSAKKPAAKAEAVAEDEEQESAANAGEKSRSGTKATKKAEDDTDETTKDEKEHDTAKAILSTLEGIQKSLNGQAVNEASLAEVMATLQGLSRSVATPPQMTTMKSAPVATIETRIDEAIDAGQLTDREAVGAQTLLQRSRLADAGRYPREQFSRDLAAAPETVRSLFAA